jgi:hypothetical protein
VGDVLRLDLVRLVVVEVKQEERGEDFLRHFNLLVEQAQQFQPLLRQN